MQQAGCLVCHRQTKPKKEPPKKLKEAFKDENLLKDIIGGEPGDLMENCYRLWRKLDNKFTEERYHRYLELKRDSAEPKEKSDKELLNSYNKWFAKLEDVFDYDRWFLNTGGAQRYDAYTLANNLGRDTCTYCNRIYTSTMKTRYGKKVMRPTFDHWFAQKRHPLLALSFYNLIPSCTICNSSVKGFAPLDLIKNLHPYTSGDQFHNFKFSYNYLTVLGNYDVKLVIKQDAMELRTTLKSQKLEEIYKAHQSDVTDLIRLAEAYSPQYIEGLIGVYRPSNLKFEEAYRMVFGTEVNNKDFFKRPLSKFKSDLLSELQILSYDP